MDEPRAASYWARPMAYDQSSGLAIAAEAAEDADQVQALVDRVFGPGRYAKAAERLREGNHVLRELSFVAREGDRLVGTVRLWPVDQARQHRGGRVAAGPRSGRRPALQGQEPAADEIAIGLHVPSTAPKSNHAPLELTPRRRPPGV